MSAKQEAAIGRAMRAPDEWALKIRYEDSSGEITDRFISPIRWDHSGGFLALCLCREEPRRFLLSGIHAWRLVKASELLMPVAIVIVRPAMAPGTLASCKAGLHG